VTLQGSGDVAKITSEDFDSWRENPITQAVFKHLERTGEQAHAMWTGALDVEEAPDPQKLMLLRTELNAKLKFISDMLNIELSDIQEESNERASDGRRD